MYIYNGQTCPIGWNTQQINVALFGGAPVDACYSDSPCVVMYIYDGQTCPTGWTTWPIGVSILNGTGVAVDACFKCNQINRNLIDQLLILDFTTLVKKTTSKANKNPP